MDRVDVLPVARLFVGVRPAPEGPDLLARKQKTAATELRVNADFAESMVDGSGILCATNRAVEGLEREAARLRAMLESDPSLAEVSASDPLGASGQSYTLTAVPQRALDQLRPIMDDPAEVCDALRAQRHRGRVQVPKTEDGSVELVCTRRPVGTRSISTYLKMVGVAPGMETIGFILYLGPLSVTGVVSGPGVSESGITDEMRKAGYGEAPPVAKAAGQNCATCVHYLEAERDPLRGYCGLWDTMVGNRAWCARWKG